MPIFRFVPYSTLRLLCSNLICLLLLAGEAYCQLGTDVPSYFETPNGNTLCDQWPEGHVNERVGDPERWYFYRNRIVGFSTYGIYFILNDVPVDSRPFATKSEDLWRLEIEKRQLQPLIWTRWYDLGDTSYDLPDKPVKYVWFYYFSVGLILYQLIRNNASNKKVLQTSVGLMVIRLAIWLFFDWHNSI